MKAILFALLLPLCAVSSFNTIDNTSNASSGWVLPSDSGPAMGLHIFGGPPPGDGPFGPAGASGDIWVNIQVPVPEDLLDAPSLQALAALIINDIEVDTGLAVTTESSFLLPTPPATIQLTGALLGGGNTCPFYHEQQVAMQCGRHVVNMLLGGPVYSAEKINTLVYDMVHENSEAHFDASDFMTPSGDYSQDVLERALKNSLDQLQHDEDYVLQPLCIKEVLKRMADGGLAALVVQYDANHQLQKPHHWLLLRFDESTGQWWDLDSLLPAPSLLKPRQAMQRVRYYADAFHAHFFVGPLKDGENMLGTDFSESPALESNTDPPTTDVSTSSGSSVPPPVPDISCSAANGAKLPCSAVTSKKRKRANEQERRQQTCSLTAELSSTLDDMLHPLDQCQRPKFASLARRLHEQFELSCSIDWLRERVRVRWEALTGAAASAICVVQFSEF